MDYSRLHTDEVLKHLDTSETGLTTTDAQSRIKTFGKNELPAKGGKSPVVILISQFTSLIVVILLIAGAISWFLGEITDAIAIWIILCINAFIGFYQEYKAEHSLESLKKYEASTTKVIRSGKLQEVNTKEIVPGDLVEFSQGDTVAADCRILNSIRAEADESILTGESQSVEKQSTIQTSSDDYVLKNVIFKGTTIVGGTIRAVVFGTGSNTKLGKIASSLSKSKKEKTNLQRKLDRLSMTLAIIGVAIIVFLLIEGVLNDVSVEMMFILALSLAVSSIPEGLPIITTIALALGIQRMAKKSVLIRKLPAVETLSSVDVICVDKTGTLTQNKMQIKYIQTFSDHEDKNFSYENEVSKRIVALCSTSGFDVGNQTEIALIRHFFKDEIDYRRYQNIYHKFDEIPFSSKIKYMATLHGIHDDKIINMKGAFEKVLPHITYIQRGVEIEKLTEEQKGFLIEQEKNYAGKGFRVIALAYKKTKLQKLSESNLNNLIFVGLGIISDPVRPDVADAIIQTRQAGIRVIMITGDQKLTAIQISNEAKLLDGKEVDAIGGSELQEMTDEVLKEKLITTKVFYRVEPEQKLRILNALQSQGFSVAMTGDGVNDSLALKRANIGLAMNEGSDISKDVSDVILLNNNFSPIPNAIGEGRLIFFNIKKFLILLISTNFDEIVVVALSILFHFPMPFQPIHILWLNLVSDGLPSIALANDKAAVNLMNFKPSHFKNLLSGIWKMILIGGLSGFAVTSSLFWISFYLLSYELVHAQTIVIIGTSLFEILLTFVIRTARFSFTKTFNNSNLNMIVLVTILIQILVVSIPFTQGLLKLRLLSITDWFIVVIVPIMALIGIELFKRFQSKSNIV